MMLLRRKKSIAVETTPGFFKELFQRFTIQLSYLGACWLWSGTIVVALTGSVPDGVTAWLTTGIWMLFYQEMQLRKTVRAAMSPVEYWRRVAMLSNVRLHIGCNAFVDIVLWARIALFDMKLSDLDKISLATGVIAVTGTALIIEFVRWAFKLNTPRSVELFLYAVFSRVVEQATVAFSSSISHLPAPSVTGLLVVASVLVCNFGLEFMRARRTFKMTGEPKAKVSRNALAWTFGSSLLNEASAGLVFGSWRLAH